VIIEVLHEPINRIEVVVGISVSEITTHHNKELISLVDIKLFINISFKLQCFVIGIKFFIGGVNYCGCVAAETIVEPENERNKAVSIGGNMGEDLASVVQVFVERLPNKFHRFVNRSLF